MSAAVSEDAIQSKTRCLRLNGSVQVRELAFFLQGIFQNENTFFILNQFEPSSEANAELARKSRHDVGGSERRRHSVENTMFETEWLGSSPGVGFFFTRYFPKTKIPFFYLDQTSSLQKNKQKRKRSYNL